MSQSAVFDAWTVGLVVQALLAVVLIAKKTWQRFPFFTAYSLYTLAETMILYGFSANRAAYFYAYVVGETISVLLGLALVYEIFTHLFSFHPALRRIAWIGFRVAIALLVILAGVVIYTHLPIGKNGIYAALFLVEEAARVLEVGLITFLFVFSSVFGLHWRQSVFGIVLGLALATLFELLAVTAAPYVTADGRRALNLAQMITNDISMVVWLAYMLAPERAAVGVDLPKTAQLERWNQAMMELINQ